MHLCVAAILLPGSLRAQETQPLSAPVAKTATPNPIHRLFPFDRVEWAFALAQASAEAFDGHKTYVGTHVHTCADCTEAEPIALFLDGPRPSWGRLIAFGTLEDWGATYLDHQMRGSHHKIIRLLGPIPQITLIALHLKYGRTWDGVSDYVTYSTGYPECPFSNCQQPAPIPRFR